MLRLSLVRVYQDLRPGADMQTTKSHSAVSPKPSSPYLGPVCAQYRLLGPAGSPQNRGSAIHSLGMIPCRRHVHFHDPSSRHRCLRSSPFLRRVNPTVHLRRPSCLSRHRQAPQPPAIPRLHRQRYQPARPLSRYRPTGPPCVAYPPRPEARPGCMDQGPCAICCR